LEHICKLHISTADQFTGGKYGCDGEGQQGCGAVGEDDKRLSVVTDLPFAVAVAQGVIIFVPFDLIKVALAALVAIAAAPAISPSRV
jgi:hypothetical protein